MSTAILVIVAVVLVAAVAVWYVTRSRRSARLREEFGPEYERALREHGDRPRAEAELTAREARVAELALRPLAEPEQARFTEEWRRVQAAFVDTPADAVQEADQLVGEVMAARGYPVGGFEERAADLSVHHAGVVQNYRAAHALALLGERGGATTEDQRKAMVHYRALFEDLLEGRGSKEMRDGRAA